MLPDYSLSASLCTDIYDDYDELRFFIIFSVFFFVCNANCNSRLVFLLCSTPTTKRNSMMGFLIDVVDQLYTLLICNTAP